MFDPNLIYLKQMIYKKISLRLVLLVKVTKNMIR